MHCCHSISHLHHEFHLRVSNLYFKLWAERKQFKVIIEKSKMFFNFPGFSAHKHSRFRSSSGLSVSRRKVTRWRLTKTTMTTTTTKEYYWRRWIFYFVFRCLMEKFVGLGRAKRERKSLFRLRLSVVKWSCNDLWPSVVKTLNSGVARQGDARRRLPFKRNWISRFDKEGENGVGWWWWWSW